MGEGVLRVPSGPHHGRVNAGSLTQSDIEGIQKLYGPSTDYSVLCRDSSIDDVFTLDWKGKKIPIAFKALLSTGRLVTKCDYHGPAVSRRSRQLAVGPCSAMPQRGFTPAVSIEASCVTVRS